MKLSGLDKKFDAGKEDILQHFDVTRAHKVKAEPKRVNIDFPLWMVQALDRESTRLGVTRQSLIKLWLSERLDDKNASS